MLSIYIIVKYELQMANMGALYKKSTLFYLGAKIGIFGISWLRKPAILSGLKGK